MNLPPAHAIAPRSVALARRPLAGLALALALALALGPARPARAEGVTTSWPSYDLGTDLAVTAVAGGGTLTLLALEQQLAPLHCRWCTPPGFDADVTRALGWSDTTAAATASDVLQVVVGVGVLGNALLDGYRRGDPKLGMVNVLLITEATSIAMLLDTGVKYAVGRARPSVWLGETKESHNGNLSFFSGHTTFAFAIAASSSTLLLSQDAPDAGLATAVSFAGAGLVGYLRIAADAHYLTDVLAGAAVGSLVGWAVPHLFHPSKQAAVQLRPAAGGFALVW
ncbi:phosphatase PAP2 family protein [Anaeromyxobacter oryzae]|uniref:Phosphatidic acid phosphatase type 2/haloperoxidase domain-containing protein n=1 Tax=Anaeromyxobacter oryzae TaxID=2918170 RepID=A0ABM7WSP1_9BACT|nr:phosphatase PAP2 family protein [Anaeromyxobacter oryzae]BDG02498.1 hypothetical protein AMOR_14940 [Anaeromyxobacter oryzae]